MKFSLAFLLPLAAASSLDERGWWDIGKVPQECCAMSYKPACIQNLERTFHLKVFYNRKKGMSPEDFNRYWAFNHTKITIPIHQRHGVVRYAQYHSTPELRELAKPSPLVEFDGAAEFWVHDLETMREIQSDPDYISQVIPDEKNFIDPESVKIIVGVDCIVIDNQNLVKDHARKF